MVLCAFHKGCMHFNGQPERDTHLFLCLFHDTMIALLRHRVNRGASTLPHSHKERPDIPVPEGQGFYERC